MSDTGTDLTTTPIQYLDRGMSMLRDLGLIPSDAAAEAPIIPSLNKISDLDEDRIVVIARTLTQASFFNEVVREQVEAMNIGERYEDITSAFDSIRDDAKSMVDQLKDGKIDVFERLGNVWMKVRRIASTRSRKSISRSPATPRTRSNASRSSSMPTAISATR